MAKCASCPEDANRKVVSECKECKGVLCGGHIFECRKCGKPMCHSCWAKNGKDLCSDCA